MKTTKWIPRKKVQRKLIWGYGCGDRMCGAWDCSTCFPSDNCAEEYDDEYGEDDEE